MSPCCVSYRHYWTRLAVWKICLIDCLFNCAIKRIHPVLPPPVILSSLPVLTRFGDVGVAMTTANDDDDDDDDKEVCLMTSKSALKDETAEEEIEQIFKFFRRWTTTIANKIHAPFNPLAYKYDYLLSSCLCLIVFFFCFWLFGCFVFFAHVNPSLLL